jgi:virulence-associated protein VagC
MGSTATAKLFRNGRSQAVRLPKEYRFRGNEVRIRREGEAVILEPMQGQAWPRGYWDRLREMRHATRIELMKVQLQDVDLDSP